MSKTLAEKKAEYHMESKSVNKIMRKMDFCFFSKYKLL